MSKKREVLIRMETTGVDADDRIIELVLCERGKSFLADEVRFFRFNPGEKPVHDDAFAIHGISTDSLKYEPAFSEKAREIAQFVSGARIVGHNIKFAAQFLNFELVKAGMPPIPDSKLTCTLELARRKRPLGPNSLNRLVLDFFGFKLGEGSRSEIVALDMVYSELLRPRLDAEVTKCLRDISRIEDKIDKILDVLRLINGRVLDIKHAPIDAETNARREASERVKKIASLSYAMAKELERGA